MADQESVYVKRKTRYIRQKCPWWPFCHSPSKTIRWACGKAEEDRWISCSIFHGLLKGNNFPNIIVFGEEHK